MVKHVQITIGYRYNMMSTDVWAYGQCDGSKSNAKSCNVLGYNIMYTEKGHIPELHLYQTS